ncbi:hypothetical protein EOC94_15665 [Mesorhizobium sp. M6A.T.Ce.TU.016.01.1.1]|nr:hypothetical protein EOC94_15665 [Mesorhizobium sp. M6A.T.Ce.TU.016.01.1.1]
MDRHPEAAAAANRNPWLPLRALSGRTTKDLNGDLAAGVKLAAIAKRADEAVSKTWLANLNRPPRDISST